MSLGRLYNFHKLSTPQFARDLGLNKGRIQWFVIFSIILVPLSSLRNAQPTFVCASLSRTRNKPQFVPGGGKEVQPHPLSYWYVVSTGLCSVLIHSDLLMPVSTWCPEMAPVQGMLLGPKFLKLRLLPPSTQSSIGC